MFLRRTVRIGLACGALLGAVSFCARAAGPARAATPDCTFEPYFEELALIQADPKLDYLAGLRAELQVRKDLLRTILTCALTETDDLSAKVQGADFPADAKDIQADYEAQIAWAADYYHDALDRIDTLGILGSKDLAREILAWRTSNFMPLAQRATNLATWTKNDELVRTAEERYTEVARTIQALKAADSSAVQPTLAAADASLHEAETDHAHARDLLANGGNADEALAAIKATLEALGAMYQHFFDLSETVSGAIPK
jgi:hypothetical protein